MWRLQDQLLDACPRAIAENKHIYIGSGHSLGKDWVCGGIGPWFLHAFGPSIVILTAPTQRQVEKVMWGETMSHWNNRKIDLGGKALSSPYLEIRKEDWYLVGFTTTEGGAAGSAQGAKFQGFHSSNMCVVVSEAQGVEDSIFDQIDAVTTGENNLVIFLGNPTRSSGRFAEGLKNKHDNIVFNFSCLENPNYIHKKTVIPGLTSYDWVEDKRKKWGEDDPRWHGRVLGQVPTKGIDTVISRELIDLNIKGKRFVSDEYARKRVTSGDFARYGDDETVFFNWDDEGCSKPFAMSKSSGPECESNAGIMAKSNNSTMFIGDEDGLGGPIMDYVKKAFKQRGIKTVGINSNGKPTNEDYQNIKAQMWFHAAEELRLGKANIFDDPDLIQELEEMKYFTNKRGKIQIESKDDIKDRIGRSPDKADAWVLLIWGLRKAKRYVKKDGYRDRISIRNVHKINWATC